MTIAYKLARQTIKTVEQAILCRDLMRQKLTTLEQTQPSFNLFEFDEKIKHPYYKLMLSADVAYESLEKLVKGVGKWAVGNSSLEWEVDVIHAKYITGVAGADAATVALIQGWNKRAITASKASDEMIGAFAAATYLWSFSPTLMVKKELISAMSKSSLKYCLENPVEEIAAECKKLVAEIKKLNKELRSVKRGKKTMLDCYSKQQVLSALSGKGTNTVVNILMK